MKIISINSEYSLVFASSFPDEAIVTRGNTSIGSLKFMAQPDSCGINLEFEPSSHEIDLSRVEQVRELHVLSKTGKRGMVSALLKIEEDELTLYVSGSDNENSGGLLDEGGYYSKWIRVEGGNLVEREYDTEPDDFDDDEEGRVEWEETENYARNILGCIAAD